VSNLKATVHSEVERQVELFHRRDLDVNRVNTEEE
jgi:hypothetical protein